MSRRKSLLAAALVSFASFTGTAFAQQTPNEAALPSDVPAHTGSIGTNTDTEVAQIRRPTSRDNRYIGDDRR